MNDRRGLKRHYFRNYSLFTKKDPRLSALHHPVTNAAVQCPGIEPELQALTSVAYGIDLIPKHLLYLGTQSQHCSSS